ncbi:MAG: hypothetical protein OET44_11335, partial [Gammaproteobacteria bacterium]|nr:hypothetical protein [Gammaproteobacteria bacterium]
MFFRNAANYRPYYLGGYPLESLPRDESIVAQEAARPQVDAPAYTAAPVGPLAEALREYLGLFVANAAGEPAARCAPIPNDPHQRMQDVKGYCYFMNASQVGVCRMAENA